MRRKWGGGGGGVHVFYNVNIFWQFFGVKNSLSEAFWQGSGMVKMLKPSMIMIQSNHLIMDTWAELFKAGLR